MHWKSSSGRLKPNMSGLGRKMYRVIGINRDTELPQKSLAFTILKQEGNSNLDCLPPARNLPKGGGP